MPNLKKISLSCDLPHPGQIIHSALGFDESSRHIFMLEKRHQ